MPCETPLNIAYMSTMSIDLLTNTKILPARVETYATVLGSKGLPGSRPASPLPPSVSSKRSARPVLPLTRVRLAAGIG